MEIFAYRGPWVVEWRDCEGLHQRWFGAQREAERYAAQLRCRLEIDALERRSSARKPSRLLCGTIPCPSFAGLREPMAVYKREWRGGEAWMVDVTIHAKRHRKQFPTRREAKAYELEVKAQGRAGTFRADAEKVTIGQVVPMFVQHLEERHRRGKRMTAMTLHGHKGRVKNYILGGVEFGRGKEKQRFTSGLGNVKLAHLTEEHVEQFCDAVFDMGRTTKTVREVRNTLSALLDFAKRKRLVGANVARSVRVETSRDGGRRRSITVPPKELVAMIIQSSPPDLAFAIKFAALTGLRSGEQWALRWKHIDFAAASVRVETRVDRWGNEDGQGAKSAAGNRTVPLAGELIAELRERRDNAQLSLDDLVFPGRDGRYVDQDSYRHRLYRVYRQVISDWSSQRPPPRPRWHDLRHFAISCWIEADLSPKAVQEFAGHADIGTTMNIYGHLFPSEEFQTVMNGIAESLKAG